MVSKLFIIHFGSFKMEKNHYFVNFHFFNYKPKSKQCFFFCTFFLLVKKEIWDFPLLFIHEILKACGRILGLVEFQSLL